MEPTCGKQSNGKGMASTSLVMGIIAIAGHFCCCCCLHPLFAILAIVFGACAKSAMKRAADYDGCGMATAGIVLGIISLAMSLLGMLISLLITLAWPCALFGALRCG